MLSFQGKVAPEDFRVLCAPCCVCVCAFLVHVFSMVLFQRTIQEHLEMHEKQRKLLEGELRKVVESQEYVERDNGAVAMLKHYYWPHGMGVEYPP